MQRERSRRRACRASARRRHVVVDDSSAQCFEATCDRRRYARSMARSVAELLPCPFADLTLADFGQIIADIGEERETLFFERKASVSGNTLAKACSAFANT